MKPQLRFELTEDTQFWKDLEGLVSCPGPSHAIAKISYRDPRLSKEVDFPMYKFMKSITDRMNKEEETDLRVFEHNGNIVLTGGMGDAPSPKGMLRSPVILLAHLDEITYYVGRRKIQDSRIIFPLCKPPSELVHDQVAVFGFRGDEKRELKHLGNTEIRICLEDSKRVLAIKDNPDLKEGDMVIQAYGPYWEKGNPDSQTPFHGKALDDRAGSLAVLYAVKELSKNKIPSKAIFTGSEEGRPEDVSWDRLIRPTVAEFCSRDSVILVSDGIDGVELKEFAQHKGEYLEEAVVVPYTADGKGPGDLGIFSILRDNIVPEAIKNGFPATTTTDYVSRSTGVKIMDDFPLISYVDWVCGRVNDSRSRCHVDESMLPAQIRNITGVLCYSVVFFTNRMMT